MQKFLHSVATILAGVLLLGSPKAIAVTFPSDADWISAQASGNVLTDPSGDVAQSAIDIIGDATHPAALFAADSTNLFFRLRVSADPSAQGFGYGVQISTNGNNQNYEFMVVVDKSSGVELWRNTIQSNSPADLAETLLSSASNATNARFLSDGNGHFFVDFAVSRADFGLSLSGVPLVFVFGTNSNGAQQFVCGSSSDIAGVNGCGTTLWSSLASDAYTFSDTTTPLPAALPLFSTGVGLLGFLGWRRKKKAAALAA